MSVVRATLSFPLGRMDFFLKVANYVHGYCIIALHKQLSFTLEYTSLRVHRHQWLLILDLVFQHIIAVKVYQPTVQVGNDDEVQLKELCNYVMHVLYQLSLYDYSQYFFCLPSLPPIPQESNNHHAIQNVGLYINERKCYACVHDTGIRQLVTYQSRCIDFPKLPLPQFCIYICWTVVGVITVSQFLYLQCFVYLMLYTQYSATRIGEKHQTPSVQHLC